MRQKVHLYIDGKKADLSDDSLILFTYSAEDADNPSIVVNSYTKTLTLAGTKQNSAIFDHIELAHHRVAGRFSPIVRTPFVIYAETGEVLETGYLKLDSITEQDKGHAYDVTLYGGLGGILYSLMYDASGRERTLADLDFYESASLSDADFTFPITAANVREAWRQLCRSVLGNARWDVVNFAPMYNGLPEGFDANKCMVTYRQIEELASGDSILATFSENVDEWQVRDLRSYLQRPVVNVQQVLDAIVEEVNATDYSLSLSALRSKMADVWMTLPRLSSSIKGDGTGGTATGSGSVSLQVGIRSSYVPAYTPSISAGSYAEEITCEVSLTLAPSSGTFNNGADYELANTGNSVENVYIVQLVARDAIGAIACSKVVSLSRYARNTADVITAIGGNLSSEFVDAANNAGENITVNFHATSTSSATMYKSGSAYVLPLTLTAFNASSFRVVVQRVDMQGSSNYDLVYDSSNTAKQIVATATANVTDNWTTASVMSGSNVTKQTLLGDTMSPAAFLIGLCRIYGFKMHYDSVTRSLSIVSRNTYYNGGTENIDGRIDHAQAQTTQPYYFTHRFYRWALDGLGKTAKGFEAEYGRPYGSMTADTGFPFNNDTEGMLSGMPFKTAADALHRDATFCIVTNGTKNIPSPFLYGGAKYRIGDTETDAPTVPSSATLMAINKPWYGYDHYPKVEMEDDSRKGVDGFVLVKFNGRGKDVAYGYGTQYMRLTDDTPEMLAANGGKPCWRYEIGAALNRAYVIEDVDDLMTIPNDSAPIPLFHRIVGAWASGTWTATDMLEIATPTEINIPDVDVSGVTDIYTRRWKKFTEDRYDVDTRVLTARVFWRGYRVTADLLRKLYTFGGAVWCLTAIKDYAMTSEQPTECTFVKIKDTANYINGQS